MSVTTSDPDPQVLLDLLVATREVERDRIAAAADAWAKAATELNRIAEGLDPHQGETFRHSWRGRAADAATAAFDRIASDTRAYAAQAQAVADALRAGDTAVETVAHKVFTEIGTKLQHKKRGGLFGKVVDWVEDTFDDQPNVDRDEQVRRIHSTYGEFIGAMQTHSHAVVAACPGVADQSRDIQREDETRELRAEVDREPADGAGAPTLARPPEPHPLARAPRVDSTGGHAASVWETAISEPVPATAFPQSSSADLELATPTDPSPGLGLVAGGAAALGGAGVAAGAAYGISRARANVLGTSTPTPAARIGDPPATAAGSRPPATFAPSPAAPGAPGPTAVAPGSSGTSVTSPATRTGTPTGPGARTGGSSGMVGAMGTTATPGAGRSGPATRYGPAPKLAEDPHRARRRKRGEPRVLGAGSRQDPPPPPDPDDEQLDPD